MRRLVRPVELDVPVTGFSTLSRRGSGLNLLSKSKIQRQNPIHLVVDSTGLKIFRENEWLHNKHKTRAESKSWRKLHLGLDLMTGGIVCADLTKDDVSGPTALPELPDQIDNPATRFLAEGA